MAQIFPFSFLSVPMGEPDQFPGFVQIHGDGLLDEHVQPGLEAGARDLAVALGRHGDDRRVGHAEDLPVVVERRAAERAGDRLGARAVGVGDRHQLAVGARGELLRVVAAHVARPDDGDSQ